MWPGIRCILRALLICLACIFSDANDCSGQTGSIAIVSANGRVSTTNMLTMLSHHANVLNMGEIFLSTTFPSLNLPPNILSPKNHPASLDVRNRVISRIRKTLKGSNRGNVRRLASIKFWHAWTNGVTVPWLAEQLIEHGCVTHFIFIVRNPVRITMSEMYGHKYHVWSYHGKNGDRGVQATVCARSHLAYHIGARWVGEMAVSHVREFRAVQQVAATRNVATLGMSYESNILGVAQRAFFQVSEFLGIPMSEGLSAPTAAKKGMLCSLSDVLVNYEELQCSLRRWEKNHGLIPKDQPRDPAAIASGNPLGLSWMASEWDNQSATFPLVMEAWGHLASVLGEDGRIAECSHSDLLDASNEFPLPRYFQTHSSPRYQGVGICGVGGTTDTCKVRTSLLFMSLYVTISTALSSHFFM